MTTIVTYITRLWMRLLPNWEAYFLYSKRGWDIQVEIIKEEKQIFSSAAFRSRGFLTPDQEEHLFNLYHLRNTLWNKADSYMNAPYLEDLNDSRPSDAVPQGAGSDECEAQGGRVGERVVPSLTLAS